jgi:cellulose synthase/poly-beta-1,6-N-acetylglucosamine synthase-like glycosyltransferase
VLVTIRAAREMFVEHRTWVLDDGDSDELRAACAEERVGYFRREDHSHAKAGNINAALRRTDGEFIVIFDADHVPSPDFLLRALPHMHTHWSLSCRPRERSRPRVASWRPDPRSRSGSSTNWYCPGRTTSIRCSASAPT